MSFKINKNGKTYPAGTIPQNVIDDVAFLKNASNYSTTEHKVGKWIDGSDLYEKTVSCGALPNNDHKYVAHGITNLAKIVEIKGTALSSTFKMPLPHINVSAITGCVAVAVQGDNIRITTGQDQSNMTESYVTIRYTKA